MNFCGVIKHLCGVMNYGIIKNNQEGHLVLLVEISVVSLTVHEQSTNLGSKQIYRHHSKKIKLLCSLSRCDLKVFLILTVLFDNPSK